MRHCLIGMLCEVPEQVEFFGRQMRRRAIVGNRPRRKVDFQFADANFGRGRL